MQHTCRTAVSRKPPSTTLLPPSKTVQPFSHHPLLPDHTLLHLRDKLPPSQPLHLASHRLLPGNQHPLSSSSRLPSTLLDRIDHRAKVFIGFPLRTRNSSPSCGSSRKHDTPSQHPRPRTWRSSRATPPCARNATTPPCARNATTPRSATSAHSTSSLWSGRRSSSRPAGWHAPLQAARSSMRTQLNSQLREPTRQLAQCRQDLALAQDRLAAAAVKLQQPDLERRRALVSVAELPGACPAAASHETQQFRDAALGQGQARTQGQALHSEAPTKKKVVPVMAMNRVGDAVIAGCDSSGGGA
ncbi:MAG: hypothetical protein WDW38_006133 [Sanguina aurantia]